MLCDPRGRGAPARREQRPEHRPHALSSADQLKVHQMLLEKGASVLDVARKLRVSPATIYRYAPRRRKDRNH
jgi:AcrR family transcriptional regulator